ncbi:hypothetical protein PROFUN_16366 [Planoprotostelium fungivorum]|uniref:Uncharacterized protein n=1 Tax=Planoprotostelium fungivorum TaxID=1890364 RepID=A0A2P6MR52_9EUKA|nr:hypothetical protein PROFUN_16366 [Planoprotostelium fungivorum]
MGAPPTMNHKTRILKERAYPSINGPAFQVTSLQLRGVPLLFGTAHCEFEYNKRKNLQYCQAQHKVHRCSSKECTPMKKCHCGVWSPHKNQTVQ